MIQLQEILAATVHLTAYTLNMKEYTEKKSNYYKQIAIGKTKIIKQKGKNKLRTAAFSLFFI